MYSRWARRSICTCVMVIVYFMHGETSQSVGLLGPGAQIQLEHTANVWHQVVFFNDPLR